MATQMSMADEPERKLMNGVHQRVHQPSRGCSSDSRRRRPTSESAATDRTALVGFAGGVPTGGRRRRDAGRQAVEWMSDRASESSNISSKAGCSMTASTCARSPRCTCCWRSALALQSVGLPRGLTNPLLGCCDRLPRRGLVGVEVVGDDVTGQLERSLERVAAFFDLGRVEHRITVTQGGVSF